MGDTLADYFSNILSKKCEYKDPSQYQTDEVLGKILHHIKLPATNFEKDKKEERRALIRNQLDQALSCEGLIYRGIDELYVYFSKTITSPINIRVLCSPIHPQAPCYITVYDSAVLRD